MRLLFMMPNWISPSEVWMQRMIEGLEQDIALIAANDTNGESNWNNRIPAVSLQGRRMTFLKKCLRRLNLPYPPGCSEEVLIKEIKKHRISHVLCHYAEFAAGYTKVWQSLNLPLFIHFHGYDATFNLRMHSSPDKNYFDSEYKKKLLILSKFSKFIANSNFTKSLLLNEGFSKESISVKYLGVPIPKQTKSHILKERINILHVGRLVDFKSPDRTILAFEKALSKGLKAELFIVGDGPLRISCELLKYRSPYKNLIHLLGSRRKMEVDQLFDDADIYTQHNILGELSNQAECFGVSIIEAMAKGLPVVACKSGGVTETMANNVTGILCEPGDIESQCNSFLKLGTDHILRQQYGEAGIKRVKQLFSQQLEATLLKKILNEKK